MKKTYQLKTNAIKGEQQVIDIVTGTGKTPVTITAAAAARYELIDTTTRSAPDTIRVMRKGKDLQIFFDGEREPGAVIEKFYEAHTDGRPTLVGNTEQGALYEYIPETASPQAVVTQLADSGTAYGLALGGQELPATGAAVGLLAPVAGFISPWLLGAGALGAAAVVGGGKGGSTVAATGKLADSSDSGIKGDNITNSTTPTLTGTVPTGSTATVTINGKTYPVVVKSDGSYSVNVPDSDPLPSGAHTPVITVTQNGTSTKINGTPFTVDTTTNVSIVNSGITGSTKPVSGTAEPGDTVEVTDATGKVIGTAIADAKGNWSLTPGSALVSGNITAKATDIAGNTATDIASNLINGGKALGLKIDMDNNNDGTINAAEKGSATTTSLTALFDAGKVAEGHVVTFSDGTTSKNVTLTSADIANAKVTTDWVLPAEGATLKITALVKDALGNSSPPAADAAVIDTQGPKPVDPNDDPVKPPTGKANLILDKVTADNLINGKEAAEQITLTGKAYGEFKNGDTLVLTINNVKYSTSVNADGAFSVLVAGKDLSADSDAKIDASLMAHDAVNNVGEITAVRSYAVDTVGPKPIDPNDDPVKPPAGKTSLVLDKVTSDNILNKAESEASNGKLTLTGKAYGDFSESDVVTLTIDTTTYSAKLAKDGSFSVDVDTRALSVDKDTKIDASLLAHDAAGNEGVITSAHAYSVDTAPMLFSSGANKVISPNGTLSSVDFKVIAPLEDGTYILHFGDYTTETHTFIASDLAKLSPLNMHFTLPAKSSLGENIFLEFTDKAGNSSTAHLISSEYKNTYLADSTTNFNFVV